MKVVVLAGGTGGAKLAAGLQELVGAELTVIANTGDDVEALGVHVSPDPDLCTYWLAGLIDAERGWGIAGDSFRVFERLVELGAPSWFGLSDLDLATCLERRRRLEAGERLSVVHADLTRALGVEAVVLPMCDEPVRTRIRTPDGWRDFQEYLVHDAAKPAIEEVEFRGIDDAAPTPEVRDALAAAEVIVLGPSNPVISIGPIIAVPGMRELLSDAAAPIVAVSPYVAGEVIKGPTAKFMRAAGQEESASGVAAAYAGLIDAFVVDSDDPAPDPAGIETVRLPTLMSDPAGRVDVARGVLEYAAGLRG
ncbi:MAG: 2-phospho-L-lactate transferase [Solirubrobacterales bacterium]|nr:2-phospho-L-lactate transferase [Solirubrobacterales bacterium]